MAVYIYSRPTGQTPFQICIAFSNMERYRVSPFFILTFAAWFLSRWDLLVI